MYGCICQTFLSFRSWRWHFLYINLPLTIQKKKKEQVIWNMKTTKLNYETLKHVYFLGLEITTNNNASI